VTDLQAVSCPSTSQCTAVGGFGEEVTFNPATPGSGASAGLGLGLASAIACPSTSQCTAVDTNGKQVTFDPTAPGTPTPTTIDAGAFLLAVACPTTTQCTATDARSGHEVTFNPTSPGTPTPTSLGLTNAEVIACPSATQCTVMGMNLSEGNLEVTFNPASPGSPTHASVASAGQGPLACASTSQCTALNFNGGEVTFNPGSPGKPTETTVLGPGSLREVTCPSETQCTAISGTSSQEVTFNPTSVGTPAPTSIDGEFFLNAIACASTSQCTVLDDAGRELTFNPASPGKPTPTSVELPLLHAIACPSTSQCTAVGDFGETEQVTFNPTSPGKPTPTKVDDKEVRGLACPSTSQCTAVDQTGREVTFNPTSPGSPVPTPIGGASFLAAISCPSTSQCTAVGWRTLGDFVAVTFNPSSPGSATAAETPPDLSAVSCPSSSLCVGSGHEYVAAGNPNTTERWTMEQVPDAYPLNSVACSSPAQCVLVDQLSNIFVGTPSLISVPVNTSPPTISGSAIQGQTLTESHGSWTNSPTGYEYQWQRCDTAGSNCAAIPGATSQAYTLTASDVEHAIRVQETASNAAGPSEPASSEHTGGVQPPPPPAPPESTSPPTISGPPQQGKALTEAHGAWRNNPTSYGYQWLRCDAAGNACAAIAGATLQAYALGASDVGHRIRVQETASNSAGAGAPSLSTQTSAVSPEPPILGQRQIVKVVSGTVTIRIKGTASFVPFSGSGDIPDGSEVDATNGRVVITAASPHGGTVSAEVYGGRFRIHQDPSGETHFILTLPLTGCPRISLPRGSAAATTSRSRHRSGPTSRHLWVSETGGKWGTNGRFVSTSVEGTIWLTLDECTKSEVKVTAGKVQVRDLVRKKAKTVLAGRRYVASLSRLRRH
jgi:hypothetical protein